MGLARTLRRLFGRQDSEDRERDRYAAADKLERNTQSHYRSVTGVDSEGRTTKPDGDRTPKP